MMDSNQFSKARKLSTDDLRSVAVAALERGGTVCLPVAGVSMGGKLARAEGLVVRKLTMGHVPIGSILVFRTEAGNWTAHRIVWLFRKHPTWFCITKGDGRWSADLPFVRADQVIGAVTAIRYADRVVQLNGCWAQRIGFAKGLSCLVMAVLWEIAYTVRHGSWRLTSTFQQESTVEQHAMHLDGRDEQRE